MKNFVLSIKYRKIFLVVGLLFTFYLSHITFTHAQTSSPTATAKATTKPSSSATPSATPKASPDETATSAAASDVLHNLRATLSRKAIIGSLDQVSETTLQIKTMDGKLVQVATSGETTFSRSNQGKKSEVKFGDLAIGDFTVAIGTMNGNNILDAKRVLSFDKAPTNNHVSFFATVEDLGKGTIKVTNKNQEDWTIETKNVTVLGKLTATKDLIAGDQIVVTGVLNTTKDKTLTADKLFVLGSPSSSATPKPTPSASGSSSSATPKASQKPSPTPSTTP